MIIDFLELKNFISHTGTRVSFAGGINVILGNNGAGKSSMMDGIRFALFGDSDRGNNSDLIHHGNGESTVRLGFHLNDDLYEILRKISITKGEDSKTDAEMTRNGELYANGVKSVNSAVESLFRISRDLFFSSIFVRQGEIDDLVSERPADRKKLFSQIIGIDELQKKAEIIKSLERKIRNGAESYVVHRDELEAKKEELEGKKNSLASLSSQLNALNLEYEKVSEGKDALMLELDSARDEVILLREKSEMLSRKKEKIHAMETELVNFNTDKKKFAEIEAEYSRINSERIYRSKDLVKSLESDLKEFNFINTQLRELARNLQEIRAHREKLQSLVDEEKEYINEGRNLEKIEQELQAENAFITEYNSRTQEVARKRKNLENMLELVRNKAISIPEEIRTLSRWEIGEKLKEFNARKGEISSGKASLETGRKHAASAIEELLKKTEMLRGQMKCPVCGSELDEDHRNRVLSDYSSKIDSLREEVEKSRSGLGKLETEFRETVNRISVLNSKQITEYAELVENTKRTEKEVEELEGILESGKDRFVKLQALSRRAIALKEKRKELEKAHSEYSRTEASIEALSTGNSVEKIEALKAERNPIEARINDGLEKSGLTAEEIPLAVKSLNEMEARIKEISQGLEESSKIDSSIREVQLALKGARDEAALMEDSVKQLNEREKLFNDVRIKFESAEKHAAELKTRIDSMNGTLIQIKEDVKYRETEIEKSEGRVKKYASIQDAVKSLSEIRVALEKDGIQKYLRRESSEAITGKTRSLVSEFGLEIDDIRVSEDFDVEVSVAGAVESLSSLSGGEKTALAIALRLSVADYVLDRVSTFIMDEPTTFLDEDRRGQLKNILQNSLRDQSIVPQLIVITHHQELTKAADVVYLVKKHDGSSEVEPVF